MIKRIFCKIVVLLLLLAGCGSNSQNKSIDESLIEAKSKSIQGLESEVDDFLTKPNTYTSSQKSGYRISLAETAYKYFDSNEPRVLVVLIKLTQQSGAADSEIIIPLLQKCFFHKPYYTIKMLSHSKSFLLNDFKTDNYVTYLYSEIVSVPSHYSEHDNNSSSVERLISDKKNISIEILKSDLDDETKKRVISLVNKMEIH